MNFETLPTEILLNVFSHFTGIDLLRTFYGLKFRLNEILHYQFEQCSFHFNTLSKGDFDHICGEHLPRMADCILNLHLSDHDETPTEIEQFLSFNPSFDRFTQLETFSVSDLRSYSTLIQILGRCHQLNNLTHLNLINGFFSDGDDRIDFQMMIDQIWSLPRLVHCTLGIGIKGHSFRPPTRISSSLQSVSIDKFQIKLNQLNSLIEHTPQLTSLSISILSFLDNDHNLSPLPTLTELSIHSLVTCNASNMAILLQNTPNLVRLNVNLLTELVDGNQWEEIIQTHLPNLTNFRLQMKFVTQPAVNITERATTLISSFETPFWLVQHQWFVHCLTQQRTIYLHTIPKSYDGDLPVGFRSTSHEHDELEFYSQMKKLTPTFFNQPINPYIRMRKIEHLSINLSLPVHDRFREIVPDLTRLKSLTIHFHNNTFQNQVQEIFNRANHLYKLTIDQHPSAHFPTAIFRYRNASIRQLDLSNIPHLFNEDHCVEFAQSPLGLQCEVLFINVTDCQSILALAQRMPKLRVLNVRCKTESSVPGDPLRWLRDRLPARCIVIRPPKLTCNILLWI